MNVLSVVVGDCRRTVGCLVDADSMLTTDVAARNELVVPASENEMSAQRW
jgi:hypothetical protein